MAEITPWQFQILIWGYELQGDPELSAQIAEVRVGSGYSFVPWDQTAQDLATMELWYGSERQPTPERWALPWVTEHLMRMESRDQTKGVSDGF